MLILLKKKKIKIKINYTMENHKFSKIIVKTNQIDQGKY